MSRLRLRLLMDSGPLRVGPPAAVGSHSIVEANHAATAARQPATRGSCQLRRHCEDGQRIHAPYDVSVNVVFLGGADFDPPPPLGTTDRTRYVKVTTLEEGQRPELHEWIEQAGRTPGWK